MVIAKQIQNSTQRCGWGHQPFQLCSALISVPQMEPTFDTYNAVPFLKVSHAAHINSQPQLRGKQEALACQVTSYFSVLS